MSIGFTFITSFFEWHGIGFLDVILQSLNDAYKDKKALSSKQKCFEPYELHKKYNQQHSELSKLDNCKKVVYLLPKNYGEIVGKSAKWLEFISAKKQEDIKNSIKKTSKNYDQSVQDLNKLVKYFADNEQINFPDYQWLEHNWRNHEDLWHIINDFSIATQIAWYKKNSAIYKTNKIELVELNIEYQDLQDEYKTVLALKEWVGVQYFDSHTYANLWGSSTTVQIAFHYLSWASPRFKNVQLIKCINEKKSKENPRFTSLRIESTNQSLLNRLNFDQIPKKALSDAQNEPYQLLKKFREFGDNFTILILGARGTGKTKLVNDAFENSKVISINCAQFQSNPELVRSELFGHKKGAFTGASEDRKGSFLEANGRTLFLDEIHHLDQATQAMLLTALQTDNEGKYSFTPLGSNKSEKVLFQFIAASNKTHEELEGILLPDLLDRISQRIVEIPKLKSGKEILMIFNQIWEEMNFKGVINPTLNDEEFLAWITDKKREFYGNCRDLQKIAILCADHQRCSALIGKTTLLNYIESKWKPIKRKDISIERFLDQHGQLSLKEMTNEFKAKIVQAAELYNGDIKSAAQMLGITPKNLIEIRNRVK